jgi:hypothetical protein
MSNSVTMPRPRLGQRSETSYATIPSKISNLNLMSPPAPELCGTTNPRSIPCALTFPINDSKLLLDPNIWIADTAASVHMTAHQQGIIDICTATSNDNDGQRQLSTATVIGTLPGTVCDQYGN